MRHQKRTQKLGRDSQHRAALLANLAVELIEHKRIKTTLAKAKALRPFAEKLVSLAKKGTLHARRLVVSKIHDKKAARVLFNDIASQMQNRNGGYTRILKLGNRLSDASEMALIEWTEGQVVGTSQKTPEKT
ncbi:50S ribosomal protein L17 [Candidatus Methylacidiphilum fumarolicum]|uniref:Large ribosomal subunit protein bL17 n=2 Tax=Candidatus Methylacidiphilum fumarolicum TaxID=591154 RepID=I0JW11_METFB|nr:50S ribosomal protein L17 [Candidatus Methylacidiphilum fumarolicum]MBW6415658.1 50S ribosomal protein L17 [Candidatus Methylacidiphilum fumarolicum]TFE66797.1 50S ribosomal protein L17 [Candidatus Methylacidiphilum fumarolicum]TFE71720.1 50S ribosomal protein L17 [Candidatus Methylacidiphilum fumarolicum]TFE73650.1 50S ribosomal protein L17 [Candidatus Methylacidiphilum fumarolicum]TFE77625.1 50S ribosomal protein L17 [Candidatus Methylacidiphilum fumarolicum]